MWASQRHGSLSKQGRSATRAARRDERPEGAAEPARAIVVHDYAHVHAALTAGSECGCAVILLSAPNAASYAGVGWFAALLREAHAAFPDARCSGILDCGDRADLAQAALREGIAEIVFRGSARVAARLADIASRQDARIRRRPPPALDMLDAAEPLATARGWLGCRSDDTGVRPTAGCKSATRRLSNRRSMKEPA